MTWPGPIALVDLTGPHNALARTTRGPAPCLTNAQREAAVGILGEVLAALR